MNRSHLAFATVIQFVIFAVLSLTAADADLWGHLTFGTDVLTSGHIVQADRYSFTSDQPWINHEWLAELAMAIAWSTAGTIGLVALKLAPFWLAGALVLAAWRPFRLPPMWRDGLLFVVALGVWPLAATVRPQSFSVVLFAALLYLLTRITAGSRVAMLAVPVVFAVWVNTHGGWLVGAGALALFVAATVADRAVTASLKIAIVLMALASALACLVNPYGIRMLDFLATTVRPDRSDILEWRPVTALPAAAFILWAIPTAVAAVAFLRGRRAAPIWHWLVIAALAIGALRVARLGGFFAMAVGILVAPLVAPAAKRDDSADRARIDWTAVAASICAAGLALGIFGRRIGMEGPWAPEPGVTEFVHAKHLHGRLLTWFDYGEYAIWYFSPALQVSMDGRRETVYSAAVRDRHAEIYRDGPGALVAIAQMRPDYIWLPKALPLVSHLESVGWHQQYVGPRSVVLGLEPVEPFRDDRPVPARRAFPGP